MLCPTHLRRQITRHGIEDLKNRESRVVDFNRRKGGQGKSHTKTQRHEEAGKELTFFEPVYTHSSSCLCVFV